MNTKNISIKFNTVNLTKTIWIEMFVCYNKLFYPIKSRTVIKKQNIDKPIISDIRYDNYKYVLNDR